MKRFVWIFIALLALTSTGLRAVVIEGHGDLYVLYNPDGSVRIVAADVQGNVLDTTFLRMPDDLKLHYFAADKDTDVDFQFTLHGRIKHPWRMEKPEKTLVVSDLHGRLDAFVAILKNNGVVDANLNWTYGKNQLIFLGDILDRGRDDNGITWLVYKLEQEADKAGGRVDFLLGNHEDLVLKDDLRYVNEAHLIFSTMAGIPYAELYGPDTELGRWIRDSYLVLVVGDNLFVHAGLSPELIGKSYKIGEINELAARFVGYPTAPRKTMHARNEFFFGNSGPFWFRGMARDEEDYSPVTEENLRRILRYYGVRRVIVGHSEVEEVAPRYDGRVITVNVRHYDNYPVNRTAGLLIEGENLYTVNYTGSRMRLN